MNAHKPRAAFVPPPDREAAGRGIADAAAVAKPRRARRGVRDARSRADRQQFEVIFEFSKSIRSIRSAEPFQSPSRRRAVGTGATGSNRHRPFASALISSGRPPAWRIGHVAWRSFDSSKP